MNESQFRDDLLSDEKILWLGRPDPSVHFTKADIFLIPFSLLWGGFAIFWEAAALFAFYKAPVPAVVVFPFFGIPFVLIGLYFILGRFWYKSFKKRHTFYALTNKRVLVLTDLRGRKLEAAYINAIPVINKTSRSDGKGTLIFGNNNPITAMYANTGLDFFGFSSFYGAYAPAFYDLKDVESVYQQVAKLR